MKRKVLLKSKRMVAFALSLSMIMGEGALANAAELVQTPVAVEAEATTEAEVPVVEETTEETGEVVAEISAEVTTEAEVPVVEETTEETETAVVEETTTETETVVVEEATEAEAPVVEETETETEAPVVEETETEASVVEETTTETEASSVEETEDVQLEEENEEVFKKVVAPYALGNVEGIAFDAETKVLSWNKVANATRYKITVSHTNATGQVVDDIDTITSEVYYDMSDRESGMTYTVTIQAINDEEWYVVAENVTSAQLWGDYDFATGQYVGAIYKRGVDYDNSSGKTVTNPDGTESTVYTLYKYPVSAEAATTVAIAAEVVSDTATVLTGVTFKEVTSENAVFTVAPAELQDGEYIEYQYSNNAEFDNTLVDNFCEDSNSVDEEIEVGLEYVAPSEKMYVRARSVKRVEKVDSDGDTYFENVYSAYVTTEYTTPKAVVANVATTVTSSSIRLQPSMEIGGCTGYQYQRKNGKKWVDLGKQSDNYTDDGLKKDTKYTYRVRSYQYNEKTKKTSYSDWKQVSAYTWGSSLKLKAQAASKNSVKLTWSKVKGAEGYEIYRLDTSSKGFNEEKGESNDSFANYTLVKTIKKAKTTKFTDKKLTKNNSYTYIVRAYRTVGKTKNYIQNSVDITLGQKAAFNPTQYYNNKGKLVVTWDKMTGISGYKVEKKNPSTGDWESVKKLKSKATSYTFPSVKVGGKDVEYRIRVYSGKKILAEEECIVEAKLAAVKGVKAVQTAEGIQVTWKAVSGADYYRVYRCKKSEVSYDKTTKTYGKESGTVVYEANYDTSAYQNLAPVSVKADVNGKAIYDYAIGNDYSENNYLYDCDTAYRISEIKGTSVVDKNITVKRLVEKEDAELGDNNVESYQSEYRKYKKDAAGNLLTEDVEMIAGPEIGNDYVYFVEAVAKPANGANRNDNYTYSAGYTKGASIVYTNVKAKKAKLSSVKSSKKATATISFKKVSGAEGYAIYRSTKKNGKYVKVGTVSKKSKSYTDNNVVSGKTYYYKVATMKSSENGTTVYSNLSSAKKVKVK